MSHLTVANVVLAVVLTNRPTEFERLLKSLAPVSNDRHLHLVVLDNSDVGTRSRTVSTERWPIAGMRRCTNAQSPGSPLHIARRELARAVADACSVVPSPMLVWLIDDDLTFEELDLVEGTPVLRNVAQDRIGHVRRLFADNPHWDVLVGGFTGDPPVRPESVIAGQLSDACFNLQRAITLSSHSTWPWNDFGPRRIDDFYDLSEYNALEQSLVPLPWSPRDSVRANVELAAVELLNAVAAIPQGRTPFRPLLPLHSGSFRESLGPKSGGNTVFRRLDDLLSHPYPALRVGGIYSRRSDMIGLKLLRLGHGLKVAEGPLTLHHDRALQDRIGNGAHVLLAEFVGVLVSRCVASWPDTWTLQSLSEFAASRASRLRAGLMHANEFATRVLSHLHSAPTFWWRSALISAALHRAIAEMRALSYSVESLLASEALSRMSERTLHAEALAFADSLLRDPVVKPSQRAHAPDSAASPTTFART